MPSHRPVMPKPNTKTESCESLQIPSVLDRVLQLAGLKPCSKSACKQPCCLRHRLALLTTDSSASLFWGVVVFILFRGRSFALGPVGVRSFCSWASVLASWGWFRKRQAGRRNRGLASSGSRFFQDMMFPWAPELSARLLFRHLALRFVVDDGLRVGA